MIRNMYADPAGQTRVGQIEAGSWASVIGQMRKVGYVRSRKLDVGELSTFSNGDSALYVSDGYRYSCHFTGSDTTLFHQNFELMKDCLEFFDRQINHGALRFADEATMAIYPFNPLDTDRECYGDYPWHLYAAGRTWRNGRRSIHKEF